MRTLFVGIDDTDLPGTPGTNQLARLIAGALPPGYRFQLALRHQLLDDTRVPYTSRNGSASLLLDEAPGATRQALIDRIRALMRDWYLEGSDPGFCVAESVPPAIREFGVRCQQELVSQDEARALAADGGVHLEGLGGTEGGVIGALAAVGLLAGGDDGRLVHRAGWPWPDAFAGPQLVRDIRLRGVDELRGPDGWSPRDADVVDVGKHLRPAYRGGRIVLFVDHDTERACGGAPAWRAVKRP